MKNKYSKFIYIFFAISIILLVIFGLIMVIIDPFYHYREPIKLVQEEEAYQNVGIAKNCIYNAILTGSSMTENFKVSQLNNLFECNTVKLSFQGGRIPNYDIILNEALKNDKSKIEKVFYGCDISAYIDEPNAQIPNKIPEYLYDDNILTDVKYVLNKTAMFNYALPYLIKYNLKDNIPNLDEAYSWYNLCVFEKSAMMAQYERPDIEEKKPINIYDENVKINCEKIGKYIKENPEIEFNMFFPPYSILYYDYFNRKGELEAVIHSQEMVAEYFLQFPNVKLSSFFADENIICNLDNYKDYTHYSEKINEYIAQEMKSQRKILNKDNYKQYFRKAKDLLYNYDYDQLFI